MSDSSDCLLEFSTRQYSAMKKRLHWVRKMRKEDVEEDDESAGLGLEPYRFEPYQDRAGENRNLSLLWPAHFDICLVCSIF